MRRYVSRETYVLFAAALLMSLCGCASASASGREPEDTVLAQAGPLLDGVEGRREAEAALAGFDHPEFLLELARSLAQRKS